jgi:hypothetical protein
MLFLDTMTSFHILTFSRDRFRFYRFSRSRFYGHFSSGSLLPFYKQCQIPLPVFSHKSGLETFDPLVNWTDVFGRFKCKMDL